MNGVEWTLDSLFEPNGDKLMDMTPKLTNEQVEALHQAGDEMPILDPSTNKFYVVVEQSVQFLMRLEAMNWMPRSWMGKI